jgi:nucleotide-binding universal stress UspA family protein
MKTILVPTDFSEAAQTAAEVAVSVAKKSDAEIVLLHVVNKKPSKLELKSIVFAVSLRKDELSIPSVLKEIQQLYGSTIHLVRVNTPAVFLHDNAARRRMEEFAQQMKIQNYTINIFNDYNEETGIIAFADNVNADLIAMSTHGRTGLSHLINGSIAEDVANHAKRLVLTERLGIQSNAEPQT